MSEPPLNNDELATAQRAAATQRAAVRAARRAAREAAALRANLRRRKQQCRAQAAGAETAPQNANDSPDQCR